MFGMSSTTANMYVIVNFTKMLHTCILEVQIQYYTAMIVIQVSYS